jgi:hypothetical protein
LLPARLRSAVLSGSLLLLCAAAPSLAQAQGALPPGVRGPDSGMATRSVSKYLDLERTFQNALAAGERSAVLKLLADDFDVRTAASPDAVLTEDWLRREFAGPAHGYRVRDLLVREFDDLDIVSFLLDRTRADGSGRTGPTQFVVDVWRRSSGKLLARYAEAPAHLPPVPSRPTGRE